MKIVLIVVGILVLLFLGVIIYSKQIVEIHTLLTSRPLSFVIEREKTVLNLITQQLVVRDNLDWVVVSKDSIKGGDLMFFKTYSTKDPNTSKLVVIKRLGGNDSVIHICSGGISIVVLYNNQYYCVKTLGEEYVHAGDSVSLAIDGEHIKVDRKNIVGQVEQVYGDYKIQSRNKTV